MSHFALKMIVAAQGRWSHMNRGTGRSGKSLEATDLLIWAAVGCGLIAGLWALSRFAASQDSRRRINSPRALFLELAKAHGLDRRDRKLLQQVGRWQRLQHLGRLFLEPERFLSANLGPALRSRQKEIDAMRLRLFGDDDAPALPG